jgi:ATP-dependent protease Clp ATPase subunit
MYDIPTMGNVEKCVINSDVVEKSAKPVLVLHADDAAA